MSTPAIVLLSGGMDSTTVLAIALDRGFEPVALSFRYGQRHAVELAAAQRVAAAAGVARHVVADIDLRAFGGSALTSDLAVPKGTGETGEIPVTYVPARNTIFLSFALACAETAAARDIFIGVSGVDYTGYPDCRPEYLQAYETMANLATKDGVSGGQLRIHAPLVHLSKAETIAVGARLGVDYSLTWSCYDPGAGNAPCGECDACVVRRRGFEEAGLRDPLAA